MMHKILKILVATLLSVVLSVVAVNAVFAQQTASSPENTKKKSNEKELTFMLKENNKVQTLRVKFLSEYKVQFTLEIDGPCKKMVSGFALGVHGDYENEEDEKDGMYPAISYKFKGKNNYFLSMSIAVETLEWKQDKAIVLEAGEENICPAVVDTMRLIETNQ